LGILGRIAIWLITREAVVCPNIRDLFTAGGKSDYIGFNKIYNNVPRIFINLFEALPTIKSTLLETPAIELSEYWNFRTSEKSKLIDWIELVSENGKKIQDAKHLDINDIITHII